MVVPPIVFAADGSDRALWQALPRVLDHVARTHSRELFHAHH